MPSLRRTFSSPSVRSSPYPTFLSSSGNIGSGRLHGHGNRRSSGSETSSRRVLADLEWWRVVDGQHDSKADQDTEDHQGQDQNGGAPVGDSGSFVSAEHLSTSLVWTFEDSPDTEINPPTSQFAALSIAPRTPPRLTRRRRTRTPELSSSSLESTPEAVETPLECIRFSLTDGFAETGVPPTLPIFSLACGPATPFLDTRVHSFDFSALLNDSAGRFADIGFTSHDHDIFT